MWKYADHDEDDFLMTYSKRFGLTLNNYKGDLAE